MTKKYLKKPSDYPLLAFRINHSEKIKIMNEIDELVRLLNSKRNDNEYRLKKNDIFIEAIKAGMKSLKATLIQDK